MQTSHFQTNRVPFPAGIMTQEYLKFRGLTDLFARYGSAVITTRQTSPNRSRATHRDLRAGRWLRSTRAHRNTHVGLSLEVDSRLPSDDPKQSRNHAALVPPANTFLTFFAGDNFKTRKGAHVVQAWVWTTPNRTVARSVRQQEDGRRTGRDARIGEDRVGEGHPVVTWSPGPSYRTRRPTAQILLDF